MTPTGPTTSSAPTPALRRAALLLPNENRRTP